jgi:hypothetical protein
MVNSYFMINPITFVLVIRKINSILSYHCDIEFSDDEVDFLCFNFPYFFESASRKSG